MAWGSGVLRYLSKVLVSIFRCLCGRRRPVEDAEREELLTGDRAELSDARRQLMVVMRHGHRLDEWDEGWVWKADRPWDPPLSSQGLSQAYNAGAAVRCFRIDYVVTSPFQRCLQTSAQILPQLGLTLDELLIDCQIGEVYNKRVMNGGLAGLPQGSLEQWMWKGKPFSDAIREFIAKEPALQAIPGSPVLLNIPLPDAVETIEDAHRRYAEELERLGNCYAGTNLLVVTHGECIRVAVNSVFPAATVYESRHTGFVYKCRTQARGPVKTAPVDPAVDGLPWGDWQLITRSGMSGVSWLV